MSAAPSTSRFVPPRAIGGQPHDQVVERDFRAVLHGEPRQPVRPRQLAALAPQADNDIGEIDQPADLHRGCAEQNMNIYWDFRVNPFSRVRHRGGI